MMSSFSENSVAAGTEIPESQAQEPMLLSSGTGGGADNRASAVYAPQPDPILPSNLSEAAPATTVYQPEGVLSNNPAIPNVVMDDQKIENGEIAVYTPLAGPAPEPMVYQPEAVVAAPASEVMNATASEAAVQVAAAADLAAPETVHTSVVINEVDDNNNNVLPTLQKNPPVMSDQNNGNDRNVNGSNQFVTPSVVGNQNGSTEGVTSSVVVSNQNASTEGVIPSVVSNQHNNGSNEVVTPSLVVNYQNNGIGNNAVADSSGVGEAIKRKRGRPRKYPISEAASTVPVSAIQSGGPGPALVNAQGQGSSQKRGRGRPAGSGKKHKADAPSPFTVSPSISGSSTGAAFMPYFITVRSGEYVQPKLLSLSQVDKQVVCVLSASGNISNVTLKQPSPSGGTVTYQGCFEILSLSGSFLLSESGGRRSITGGLSVSLAVPNGCIFGGGVAGPLIADSDVQIIVGTFLASEQHLTIPRCNEVLTAPPNHISSAGESPPSRALKNESSGAVGSPFYHSNGGFNNGNQQPVPKVAWM